MSVILNSAEKAARGFIHDARTQLEYRLFQFAIKLNRGIWACEPLLFGGGPLRMEFIMNARFDVNSRSDNTYCEEYDYTKKAFNSRNYWSLMVIFSLLFMSGCYIGLYLGINWLIALIPLACLFIRMSPPASAQRKPVNKLLMGKTEGLYAIKQGSIHRGVGYLTKGTLYTRHHITEGLPLRDGDQILKPSFVNIKTDNVAYGFLPTYADLDDGEEVFVLLTGIDKRSGNIVSKNYKTSVHVDQYGTSSFQVYHGDLIGYGGSPVLKMMDKKKHCIVGTLGLHIPQYQRQPFSEDLLQAGYVRSGMEIMILELGVKWVLQIFETFPPRGYELYLPALAHSEDYPHVFITCPTLSLCERMFELLRYRLPGRVRMMTSSTFVPRGDRGVIVGPHDIMLEAILKNRWFLEQQMGSLWIIDWADHVNIKTLCLKDLVRHMARTDPCVSTIERATAGYSLRSFDYHYNADSVFTINDIQMDATDMVDSMLDDAASEKVLTFVTSQNGDDPTSGRKIEAEAKARRVRCVTLYKDSLTRAKYNEAKNMEHGLILVTDIIDSNVDFSIDTIYDFMISEQMLKRGDLVSLHKTRCEKTECCRRRSLLGQVKEGTYVSPEYNDLLNMNKEKIEYHDRAVFTASANIDVLESLVEPYIKLDRNQALHWMSSHDIRSPRLIDMIFDVDGIRSNAAIHRQIKKWLSSDKVSVTRNGRNITCAFWDERDDKLLTKLAAIDEQTISQLLHTHRRRSRQS